MKVPRGFYSNLPIVKCNKCGGFAIVYTPDMEIAEREAELETTVVNAPRNYGLRTSISITNPLH